MRKLIIAALCASFTLWTVPHRVEAQGVTRICQQTIGSNGSNNCVDVGNTQPFNVTPILTATACTGVINISQTASTDVHTFTKIGRICAISLTSASAQNIGIDEGTGTTCETGGTALIGVSSTSAATPTIALAANTGITVGAGFPFMQLQATGDHLCVLQSSTGNVSGTITYADQ
jgi:hypothetical protein